MYIHQTKFLGETSLNLPEDLFNTKLDIINMSDVIEIRFAWGGTGLFIASILDIIVLVKLI